MIHLKQIRIVHVCALMVAVTGFPAQQNSETNEITSKLARLKTLLEKLDVQRNPDGGIQEPSDSGIEPPLAEQANLEPHKTYETIDTNKWNSENVKNFIDSLTEEELIKLKLLRGLTDNSVVSRNTGNANTESSRNKPSEDNEGHNHQSSIQDQLSSIIQEEKNPDTIPAVVMKGKFLPSKDEIKYAVEKNLLLDMALAIHSGISVDELIQDITGHSGLNLDGAIVQGEWMDTSK